MDIIRFTIHNPVKVAVGVILVCLFGGLALFQIPIQLTPNVDEPKVVVTTRWPGKNAREIEREIIDRQEEKLKGATSLRKMTSKAVEGQAEVTLEFFIGTDKEDALFTTNQKLNQVSGYPPEVEEPEIVAADAALANPIAWILLHSDNPDEDVSTLRDFIWDEVKPSLERVDGLASVDVYGGREREVQVLIDPARLAARGITLREVQAALEAHNKNISAGTIDVGKRELIYRTVLEPIYVRDVENTVITYTEGGPVFVRDVARVVQTHEKVRSFVRSKGRPVLAIPARRETGSNVIEVMAGLKKQIAEANRDILEARGLKLELTQVYDETVYIHSAIDLVRNNLFIGGTLAVIVLLVFLRSSRATGVVAVSIPVSVIGTILAVSLLGRNINVVMLAGMAFAVGMVVDNAVVVLENIYRHRQMGKSSFQAAQDGATEVWGAILASTLTTMAVFIPVLFIEAEAGQLFRDIAIAITTGVGMSLIVAVMVIPTLSARVLGRRKIKAADEHKSGRFATLIADFVSLINRYVFARVAVIVVFLVGSLLGSYFLLPPTDYLPSGNRNLVFGFVITEPGLGINSFKQMAFDIEDRLRPYWTAKEGSEQAKAFPDVDLPTAAGPAMGGDVETEKVRPALIDNFFFVAFNNTCFMGAISRDDLYVAPLRQQMQEAVMSAPSATGAFPFFFQVPLFSSARGGAGNSVDVEIRGQDLNKVTTAAGQVLAACMQRFGFTKPDPSTFDLPRPEIRAIPDRVRAADVGLNVRDLGFIIEAAVDGAYVGGFREGNDEIDMVVKLENADGTLFRDVPGVPIYTPAGQVIPISSVVDFQEVGAPQQINHIEEMPAISLQVQAPKGQAMESVMDTINNEIVGTLRQEGKIDDSVYVSLAGNADKLVQTRAAMFGQWTGFNAESLLALLQSRGLLALVVVYLLMAALFESFIHPLAILLTVPLAMVGGFGGLAIVHWLSSRNPVTPTQQLDVVTMLGFVILLGIVVNNAILIVHQTLNNLKRGLNPADALHESVRTRVRPIFMTAFTSIGGMLPLALMTGAGSELYRGLAAVMVGGLLVSTVFTIILVPVVYSMILNLRIWLMRVMGREDRLTFAPATASAATEPGRPLEKTTASPDPVPVSSKD